MREKQLAALETIGLSTAEAQIYLALARAGAPMGASAVVAATGVPRSSVYPTLSLLANKGLVEVEAGYGGRFSAVPAERALPFLIAREKEKLIERESLAATLASELKSNGESAETETDAEFIQVLKDPRVIAERYERLQLEARRSVEGFVKAPLFVRPGNPVQERTSRKGVSYRGLYEQAVMDAPGVKPYLSRWVAQGEEVRIYNGELPHKLVIFDRQSILMPLIRPGGGGRTLLIRHPQLAVSLGMLFDTLWNGATPLVPDEGSAPSPALGRKSNAARHKNNHKRQGPTKSARVHQIKK